MHFGSCTVNAGDAARLTLVPAALFTGMDVLARQINLHRGDCFELLEHLPDASIDAVITDPPFGNTNCSWDYKLDLDRWWEIIARKLKPAGIVAAFACGHFVFELYNSKPGWFRYDLVWEKSAAVGFLNANRQPMRAHETILVFMPHPSLSTYNPQKTAKAGVTLGRVQKRKGGHGTSIYDYAKRDVVWVEDGTRHPRSVLKFDSVTKATRGHPTQKPIDLMRWLVRTYTNKNSLVVDSFFGSGTTPEACAHEGRRFFGCENDADYFRFAQKRLSEAERAIRSAHATQNADFAHATGRLHTTEGK